MTAHDDKQTDEILSDANMYLAVGAGVGAMGTGAALLTSAVCPLCVVIAPALVGIGTWMRCSARRKQVVRCEHKDAPIDIDSA